MDGWRDGWVDKEEKNELRRYWRKNGGVFLSRVCV